MPRYRPIDKVMRMRSVRSQLSAHAPDEYAVIIIPTVAVVTFITFVFHLLHCTWRAGTTVEGTHGVQALHHRSGGAATIVGQTFIHILTAVTVALPA